MKFYTLNEVGDFLYQGFYYAGLKKQYLDERLFISPCCASWSFTTDTGKMYMCSMYQEHTHLPTN